MKGKRNVAIIAIIMLAIIALIGGSYAAYTSLDSVRRVITTSDDETLLPFSSNYMHSVVKTESTLNTAPITVSATNETTRDVTITVCNYPQTNISFVNDNSISYVFSAKLVKKGTTEVITSTTTIDGADQNSIDGSDIVNSYSIRKSGTSEGKNFAESGEVSFGQSTLKGGILTTDSYVLTVPVTYMEYVDVLVYATPSDESFSATDNYYLASRISTTVISNVASKWTGIYIDDNVQSPKQLSGFNFEISGTNTGTITLSWNTNYVDLSPYFTDVDMKYTKSDGSKASFIESDSKDTSTGIRTLVFTVGAAEQSNSYQLQFYRTNGTPSNEGYNFTYGVVADISNPEETRYISFQFEDKQHN